MKNTIYAIVLLSILLAGCGDFNAVTSAPNPFAITPSRAPLILTATPIFLPPTTSATLPPPPSLTPSATATETPTSGPTFTFTAAPTDTETPSPTPSFTLTPRPPAVTLLGCDTGLDLTHGMGEVTNAYVTIANPGGPDLTNVCATLSAADEGRVHPDKVVCVPLLSTGFQVTLKLTVDTTSNVASLVQVAITSDQLTLPANPAAACPVIGASRPADSLLGAPIPIP